MPGEADGIQGDEHPVEEPMPDDAGAGAEDEAAGLGRTPMPPD